MCEIHMQKTVQIASNLYAKNSAKCVQFICKKQCKLRQIYMQKKQCELREFSANFAVFLADKFGAFFSVFCRKNWQKIEWQFCVISIFFVTIFYVTVCRDGKGGISVKSRSNFGHPDWDCTENTRLCSAMSTKSEIVKVIAEKRLTPRSNRKPAV